MVSAEQKHKANHLMEYFTKKADEAIERVEFYKLRSVAKDKEQAVQYWQSVLNCCTDTIEILEDYISNQ